MFLNHHTIILLGIKRKQKQFTKLRKKENKDDREINQRIVRDLEDIFSQGNIQLEFSFAYFKSYDF